MYVPVCLSRSLSLPVCLHVCVCLCMCLSVHVSVCACVCLSVHVSVCLCMCLSVCACVCLSVHVSVCACVCLCMCLSVHVSVCACVCLCMCLSVHVSVCACVCLCMCLSVHVSVCGPFLVVTSALTISIIYKHNFLYYCFYNIWENYLHCCASNMLLFRISHVLTLDCQFEEADKTIMNANALLAYFQTYKPNCAMFYTTCSIYMYSLSQYDKVCRFLPLYFCLVVDLIYSGKYVHFINFFPPLSSLFEFRNFPMLNIYVCELSL